MSKVYRIVNKINGVAYIGQTTFSIEKRWKEHIRSAKDNNKKHYLTNAIRKYGEDKFYIEIIKECETLEELNKAEIEAISSFNTLFPNGYNLRIGGNSGGKLSQETRRKISAAQLGKSSSKKGKKFTHSSYPKNRKSSPRNSEETRNKISLANSGRECKEEVRQKISEKNKKPKFKFRKPIKLINQETNEVLYFDKIGDVVQFGFSRSAVNNVLIGKSKLTNKIWSAQYIEVNNE